MANKSLTNRLDRLEAALTGNDVIRIFSEDGEVLLHKFTVNNPPTWTWFKDAPEFMLEQMDEQRQALGLRTLDDYYPTDEQIASWEAHCKESGYKPLHEFLREHSA